MKIVFNLQSVGLGNNGGSRTLIKCAETLQVLGHKVSLWCGANNYEWEPIRVPVVKNMPKCDVIVATGVSSVPSTVAAKVSGKFYYIRGFETWRVPAAKLVKSYKILNCIVNSEWLKSTLASHGVASTVVYPGLDLKDFYVESEDREPTLGGLFSKRHASKRHEDVIRVGEKLKIPVKLINRDIQHATPSQLREFYNSIMVWMSPSELEGLHNPPHEASLCGASLVGTNHPRGGIQDYAKDERTALLYPAQNLDDAIIQIRRLLDDAELRQSLQKNMQDLLRNEMGDRFHNMSKFVKVLKGELK